MDSIRRTKVIFERGVSRLARHIDKGGYDEDYERARLDSTEVEVLLKCCDDGRRPTSATKMMTVTTTTTFGGENMNQPAITGAERSK